MSRWKYRKNRMTAWSRAVEKSRRSGCEVQCVYCNCALSVSTFTADHIVPRSAGGSDDVSNLAVSCEKCNRGLANKSAKFKRKPNATVLPPVPDSIAGVIKVEKRTWGEGYRSPEGSQCPYEGYLAVSWLQGYEFARKKRTAA